MKKRQYIPYLVILFVVDAVILILGFSAPYLISDEISSLPHVPQILPEAAKSASVLLTFFLTIMYAATIVTLEYHARIHKAEVQKVLEDRAEVLEKKAGEILGVVREAATLVETSEARKEKKVPVELFDRLARKALTKYRNQIRVITDGSETYSTANYFREIADRIANLKEGSKLWAACNDERWEIADVRGYFGNCLQAATSGRVQVERIFIIKGAKPTKMVQRLIDDHVRTDGATAILLTMKKIKEGSDKRLRVPEGMGFAIIDNGSTQEAWAHFPEGSTEGEPFENYGKVYKDKLAVTEFIEWYRNLKALGDIQT